MILKSFFFFLCLPCSLAPPTFTKTPPPVVEALAGSRLSLSCVAKGNPVPSITWLKDGAGLREQGVEVCVSQGGGP